LGIGGGRSEGGVTGEKTPATHRFPPMARTAQNAYLATHQEVLEKLQKLQEALFDMPAPDGEAKIDWNHVGSITEINRQLKETLDFMTGTNA